MNDDNETPLILLCMSTEDDCLAVSLRAHEYIGEMPAELLREGIIGWIHCLEQMLDDIYGRDDTVH
jgi:hypothetical protein